MSLLPHGRYAALNDDKILKYLLNPAHPDNGGKDHFFRGVGFSPTQWQIMKAALLEHPMNNQVAKVETNPYGVKYIVECNIQTPDGSNQCIRSVWIISNGGVIPEFVTVYKF